MTAPAGDDPPLAKLLAEPEPEPAEPRPLADLVARLRATEGLDGIRVAGRPVSPRGIPPVAIAGVTDDSRAVRPGSLFVAVPGFRVDGHGFLAAAVAAGAVAAIVERADPSIPIPQVVVERSAVGLSHAAAWWYGDPSRALGVVGITGTDGKTTTSFLATAALEAAGLSTGLVGTVETKVGATRSRDAEHVTTPGAVALQRLLAAMLAAGNVAAVVETTSHALALGRVADVAYDAAILTNLTHEHLDLHGTWEAYRDAKLSLFERLAPGARNPVKAVAGRPWPKLGIVNRDDPSADLFMAVAREAGARVLTYGTDERAQVRATAVAEDARRLRVGFVAPSGSGELTLRLAGRFNVHNALAVVALGDGLGLDPAAVRTGLEQVTGVPGRMERIDRGQPFAVIVDYAHSPASLTAVLDLLAPLALARGGGLIAVFGSAGERDVAKRAVMGRIAGERCRLVVLTDEDPRGEDREAILDEIASGAESVGRRRGSDLLLVTNRRAAIAAAFERARPGDVVLLAGKGHEATILYADGPVPWDEAGVARDELARLGWTG